MSSSSSSSSSTSFAVVGSDDEIIWSICNTPSTDGDYVVLRPSDDAADLVLALSTLSIDSVANATTPSIRQNKPRRKKKAPQQPQTPDITEYNTASDYITQCIDHPHTSDRLTLLRSLIVELGLSTTNPLPSTLTAAKALLKSRAFLNIRDYLATRSQGQAALQQVMHPNRKSLIQDIRKKGNRASLGWVKKHGLQVLLVTCH